MVELSACGLEIAGSSPVLGQDISPNLSTGVPEVLMARNGSFASQSTSEQLWLSM